ncbi:alpha/beta fold hydrolase [Hyphomonas johnsonii]|uniref:Alpha/beta hydrolase fold protein n=1 Tax=Hyphomonas johnsonii MHS-2 TaxID=1280950 RepID=A0A059FQU6_9PROT|nr:alpha/beta hydrolase [Hyphomonas johnsonii]KCZ92987.1 alpha/beta hydrolase fold protein [Hyphomonas johnsonii MHS-2]
MTRILLAAAACVTAILLGAYVWAGLGQKPLDDAARAEAPGQFLQATDGQLHYQVRGPEDGPVVVMVHGFSTPSFIFEQNAAALAEAGFRVVQFDHFGRGWSDRPDGPYDAAFYDRELMDLLDGLGLTEPVGLVGLSMGGPIVVAFAGTHPARVSEIFLFVPAGLDVAGADSTMAKLVRMPVVGDWIWRVFGRGVLLGDPQYDESGIDPEYRLQGDVRRQMDFKGYRRALLSTLRNFPMTDRARIFDTVAKKTSLPVMAVFGDADATVEVSSAAKLQALIPRAQVRVIKGGTHGLNYQRHTEVDPMLVEWFSQP